MKRFKEDTKTDYAIRVLLTLVVVAVMLGCALVVGGEVARWTPDAAMTTQEYSAMVKEGRLLNDNSH